MGLNLDQLVAELERNERVDESARLLMERLFQEVEANKANPQAIQAVVDRFRASNDALSAAVATNTPGEEGGGGGGGEVPPPEDTGGGGDVPPPTDDTGAGPVE
jgi:hypothetical protein